MEQLQRTSIGTRRPAALLATAALLFSAMLVTTLSGDQGQAQATPPKASTLKIIPSATPPPDPPVKDMTAEQEDAWAADAETTIKQLCSTCHPPNNLTNARHTWREWNDIVKTMVAMGSPATDEQSMTIKLYATRYYGLVRVNTASAAEIAAVLGLSAKDAAAVVDYRKAGGKFTDLASLEKVPGIDKAKLEEQPEAIRFD